MSEMSLHHFVSEIDTLWNKCELHLLGLQRFKNCCADIILTLLHTLGHLWPYTSFYYIYIYIYIYTVYTHSLT